MVMEFLKFDIKGMVRTQHFTDVKEGFPSEGICDC